MGQAKNWTIKEKSYLIDNWGTVSVPTLCKKLKRSENAIMVMKNRLDLGPFLECGDYISWNQLQIALGLGLSGSGYKITSWIRNRNFPLHIKRVNNNSFKIVYIEEFWKWAKDNRDFLDFSKFEENVLGEEPEWVKVKRRIDFEKNRKYVRTPWTAAEDSKLIFLLKQYKYTYDELSKILRRTNGAIQRRICDLGLKDRPVKADNHIKWTDADFELLGKLIKSGYGYDLIAESIGKSCKAVRGRVYSMYLTENLDMVRKYIGDGKFGDNRPERKIKQWNVMNTKERIDARNALISFTAILKNEFKNQINQTEWGEFFQKDMCINFSGECLNTAGCDECNNYIKIEPQYCKMCGNTFFDKKITTFCSRCRNMRKKQYLRKRAALIRK